MRRHSCPTCDQLTPTHISRLSLDHWIWTSLAFVIVVVALLLLSVWSSVRIVEHRQIIPTHQPQPTPTAPSSPQPPELWA